MHVDGEIRGAVDNDVQSGCGTGPDSSWHTLLGYFGEDVCKVLVTAAVVVVGVVVVGVVVVGVVVGAVATIVVVTV